MGNYVLSFRARADRTPPPGEDAAWGAWFGSMGAAVVDAGHRVGRVHVLSGPAGTAEGDPAQVGLTGYVVVAADDMEAAVALASGCPGLASGATVEVGEAIQM